MKISARDIEFDGRHGATAAERKSSRRFQVDLDVVVADQDLHDVLDLRGVDQVDRLAVASGEALDRHRRATYLDAVYRVKVSTPLLRVGPTTAGEALSLGTEPKS